MSIEVGEKVQGKVSGITNFGAFIDLGDHKTGLVHISQISDKYVKDIHDILNIGDEVTVKVLKIDGDKIGLSMKAANPSSNKESSHSHSFHHNGEEGQRSERGNFHHDHEHNHGNHSSKDFGHHGKSESKPENFDEMMSGFLKESEDRLATIRRNTEGKRGGRGGRRS